MMMVMIIINDIYLTGCLRQLPDQSEWMPALNNQHSYAGHGTFTPPESVWLLTCFREWDGEAFSKITTVDIFNNKAEGRDSSQVQALEP